MHRVASFFKDETGSQTIEFVLWVPIFVGLLTVVMEASTLYITQSEMENVARDTARRMVMGMTQAEAETHALNAMSLRDFDYDVSATFDPDIGADVTIAIQTGGKGIMGYPLSPIAIAGSLLGARVIMRPDPTVPYETGSGGGGGGGGNG